MMNLSVPVVSALVGVAILLLGRKLFWLFVAAMGFVFGAQIAAQVTHQPASSPVVLLVAIGLGIVGAVLAILLQKIAIGVAGFIAGGRIAVGLSAAFFAHPPGDEIIFVIGGILSAILFLALFDWALIFFSSVEGAHLIASAIVLPQTGRVISFIVLVVIGIFVQSSMLSPARRSARR
jgi:Domain of unknown function (DUF4203)